MKNRIIAAFLSFSFLSFLLPYSLAEENKKSKDADELLEAIEQHKVQQVRDLLKNNSTLANTRFEDSEGYGLVTPLFYAIKVKDAEICKLLIQAGADVNFVTVVFGAPLHYAIFKGEKDIVLLLLESKADLNKRAGFGPPQQGKQWFENASPLHLAITRGEEQIVRLLIQKGADLRMKMSHPECPSGQCSPLEWAIIAKRPELIPMLKEQGRE